MKTATSLVVAVVISTILDEWFIEHITHGRIVEPCQDVGEVGRQRIRVGRIRRGRSSSCLELAVEAVTRVDHCFVVADMPKGLAK